MTRVVNKGDILYYARINNKIGMYDLLEFYIRTVTDDYFVGIDKKDKQAHIFGYNAIGDAVFQDRADALKKIKEAEKNKKSDILDETYYEEY